MIVQSNLSKSIGSNAVSSIFNAADNVSMLALFSGPIPDVSSILPVLGTSGTAPSCAAVCTALGITQDSMLSVLSIPSLGYVSNANGRVIQFSTMTDLMKGLASGTPTYAIVRQASGAAASASYSTFASTSLLCNNLMILTVGDEKSSADIQILGGKIVSGQNYSLTDLLIAN